MKLKRKEDHLSFRRNFSSSEKKASNNSGLYGFWTNDWLSRNNCLIKADRIYDQIVSLLQCTIKTNDNEKELCMVNINVHKLLCCTCLH